MAAKITRPDPMRAGPSGPPKRVFISILTYESRDDLKRLPKNVNVGLAVPKQLSEEEWLKQAQEYRAKQLEQEGACRLIWDKQD